MNTAITISPLQRFSPTCCMLLTCSLAANVWEGQVWECQDARARSVVAPVVHRSCNISAAHIVWAAQLEVQSLDSKWDGKNSGRLCLQPQDSAFKSHMSAAAHQLAAILA